MTDSDNRTGPIDRRGEVHPLPRTRATTVRLSVPKPEPDQTAIPTQFRDLYTTAEAIESLGLDSPSSLAQIFLSSPHKYAEQLRRDEEIMRRYAHLFPLGSKVEEEPISSKDLYEALRVIGRTIINPIRYILSEAFPRPRGKRKPDEKALDIMCLDNLKVEDLHKCAGIIIAVGTELELSKTKMSKLHDAMLSILFVEPLINIHPSVGAALSTLWAIDGEFYSVADGMLQGIIEFEGASGYMRASGLAAYGCFGDYYARQKRAMLTRFQTDGEPKNLDDKSSFTVIPPPLVDTANFLHGITSGETMNLPLQQRQMAALSLRTLITQGSVLVR